MRWNRREWTIGCVVTATALLVAVPANIPVEMLLRHGMTQDEVNEALWVGGTPDSFHDCFPSRSQTPEQQRQSCQDFYRNASFRYKYDTVWGTVVVSFRHTDDVRRAHYIEVVSTSNLLLVLDVVFGVVLGAAAAAIARSVRPDSPMPPAVPVVYPPWLDTSATA